MIVYVNRRTKRVVTSARFDQLIEEQLSSGRSEEKIRKDFLDEWAGAELEDVINQCEFHGGRVNDQSEYQATIFIGEQKYGKGSEDVG